MNNIETFGISYLKKGKGIHIKKKNRGKFTEYCGGEVTDKCILKAKKSGNSKLVKRAVFALNARGWSKKHKEGGEINNKDVDKSSDKSLKRMNPENNLSTKEAALLKLKLKRTKPFGLGLFGGGGAGTQFSPIKEELFELVKDTLWVPVLESYNDAFANARKKGLKTFMFNGELKNTELGNDPKALEAGAKRFQNVGLIPIERTKLVEKKQEVPKGQEGLIAKLNPLNWFKKDPILKSRKFVENWYNNKTTLQVFNLNYNDYWKPILLEWSNPELFRLKRDIESNIYLGELHVLPEEYMQDLTNKLNEVNKQIELALLEEGDISMSNTNNALKTSIDTMHSHAYGYYEDLDFINPKGKDILEGINVHNSDYARNEHVKGVNGRNITSYRNRDWAKKSAGHEEMHSMHLKESEHAISNILQKYGYDTETYLDCGSEALSRLMNVRLLNKLNPNDRNWTPERVMKLQKNNKGDDRFLNRYSPEAIADIFNLVADNSQNNMNQDNGIHFAKRGNKLRYLYGL